MEVIRFLLWIGLVGVAAAWVGWILWGTGFLYPSAGDLTGDTVQQALISLHNDGFTNVYVIFKDKELGDPETKIDMSVFRSPSRYWSYLWTNQWVVHDYEPCKKEYRIVGDKYFYHLCPLTKHSKVTLIAYVIR